MHLVSTNFKITTPFRQVIQGLLLTLKVSSCRTYMKIKTQYMSTGLRIRTKRKIIHFLSLFIRKTKIQDNYLKTWFQNKLIYKSEGVYKFYFCEVTGKEGIQ